LTFLCVCAMLVVAMCLPTNSNPDNIAVDDLEKVDHILEKRDAAPASSVDTTADEDVNMEDRELDPEVDEDVDEDDEDYDDDEDEDEEDDEEDEDDDDDEDDEDEDEDDDDIEGEDKAE